MSAPPNQRNRVTALALFAVALALRVPFRSQYAYHWDGAQFALAIQHFDLRIGQPHAPGCFHYVMLGRLVNAFVGNPLVSLGSHRLIFNIELRRPYARKAQEQ